jgi:uncharacterized protein YyaL (SSP411 family)
MKHWLIAARDRFGAARPSARAPAQHLEAAAQWVLRAQAANGDDGVAHSYDVRTRAWLASYPETTGYMIPTLYDYAAHFGRPAYREAARKMALWEVEVQLDGGGVRAGTMAAPAPVPTVFNTGQVLFGLARAAQETADARFVEATRRAADWLVEAQDEDGCWRRHQSPFTTTTTAAYNTRSAFGLVRAFAVVPEQRYLRAAQRNAAWALGTARPNGWLPGNCLTLQPDDRALTHTIAYAIRGLLEVGVALERPELLEHALRMARAVAQAQRADGALPGYLGPDWRPLARWSCVTGNAQMALNWLRLARETGCTELLAHARAANAFNMAIHEVAAAQPQRRGGVKGSHPISGDYMRWRYPNWAAKFFMDALMLQELGPAARDIG